MRLAAPAKINLGLRIVGRRDDGYHLLASVFVPLALADEVRVERVSGSAVELHLEGGPSAAPGGAANLAHRAACAFRDAAGIRAGLRVGLRKQIPVASGLGGGSSDAAATLRALAVLFPGALAAAELQRLALGLGADVPFFLDPRPALVTGIGEIIDPLPSFPALSLVLAHPGTPLPTAEVYAAYDASGASLTLDGAGSTLRRLVSSLGEAPVAAGARAAPLAALLVNDLEAAATGLCPVLATLREALAARGAQGVGMSGSGPTMYGVFEDPTKAREAGESLQGAGVPSTWLTSSMGAP